MKYAISYYDNRLGDWDILRSPSGMSVNGSCRAGKVLHFDTEEEAQDHLDDLRDKKHPIRRTDSQVVPVSENN
jgi:hypothetical protein